MTRTAIIGNAGGGKSTLARAFAAERGVPHVEVDRLLWQDGWKLTPPDVYDRTHDEVIQRESWVMDGLGQRDSIPRRLARATEIILVDMPLWMHFWLAAERHIAWAKGTLDHPPGNVAQAPPTEALFRTIWEVDQDWMPEIRTLCVQAASRGVILRRLTNVAELTVAQRRIQSGIPVGDA